MRFYLGVHEPHWLVHSPYRLFMSRRRLNRLSSRLPRARTPWALDSGGFSELSMYDTWQTTPSEYIFDVYRYVEDVGKMEWAAPMDWMCEPHMIEKTGMTVEHHQQLTVINYLELVNQAPDLPWVPVIQGWEHDDYWACIELYAEAGVDLYSEPLVGIGSVCRRQSTVEILEIITDIGSTGIKLHGFGVKQAGIEAYGGSLASADSMAWSYAARKRKPLPGCTHQNCSNCYRFAMEWRYHVLGEKWMTRT